MNCLSKQMPAGKFEFSYQEKYQLIKLAFLEKWLGKPTLH